MRITQRDEKLLSTLSSFGLLKTSQIHEIIFKTSSKSALLRRLNILEKEKFIRRIKHYEEAIWSLTHVGARQIGEEKAKKSLINHNTLTHDVLLSEIRFKLEKNGMGEDWKLEHSLRHKILSEAPYRNRENLLVPDALFIVTNKQKEAVAMELELHKKSYSRYKNIFQKYQEKKNLFCLWYIVRDEKLGLYLEDLWENTTWKSNSIHFVFSLLDDVRRNPKEAIVYENKYKYKASKIF